MGVRGRAILSLVLVGPATCKGCGAFVWWRVAHVWDGWTEKDGKRHRCAIERAA